MLKTKLFVACSLFIAAPAVAESPFDGTWKMDPAAGRWSGTPINQLITGGTFDCISCNPRFQIKADGNWQKRPGSVDESSVQIISDRAVKIASRKDGKMVSELLVTADDDGSSRTIEAVEYAPNGMVSRVTAKHRRVGPAPAGAHAVSGQWQMERLANIDEPLRTITFKGEGDQLSMTTPDGYSYKASFGGQAVVVTGDRNRSTVQLRRISANAFEETERRDGKVVGTATWTVRPDGRLHLRSRNELTGQIAEHEFVRQ